MYLIFDTETTGLPKKDNAPVSEVDNWPRVVQIAWQLHDVNGDLLEHYNTLVRPEGFQIPYSAEKIHGISTEKANKHGLALADALEKFNVSLGKSTFLIGHNISFDINALGAEFIRCKLDTDFLKKKQVCTMRSSTEYMKLPGGRGGKFKPPKLMELYESLFEEQFLDAHNASADVEATARCFFELLRIKIISPDSLGIGPEEYGKFIASNQGRISLYGLNHRSNWEEDDDETEGGDAFTDAHTEGSADAGFCHLHVHTQYSILDGAASIPELLKNLMLKKL